MDIKHFDKKTTSKLTIATLNDVHHDIVPGEFSNVVTSLDSLEFDLLVNLGDMMRPDLNVDSHYLAYITDLQSSTNHPLNKHYHIIGNHDLTKKDDPLGRDHFFKKYCSPVAGDNSYYTGQPYGTIANSTYQCWGVEIGNLLLIGIGDDNAGDPPGGENGLGTGNENFRASGHFTRAQWNLFKSFVESNTDKIILVFSHVGIKDTTIGTGYTEFEGALSEEAFYDSSPQDEMDSHTRGYVGMIENLRTNFHYGTGDSDESNEIKTWFETWGKYIDMFLSGHIHTKIGQQWAGRGRYVEKYGTHFLVSGMGNSKLALLYNSQLEVRSGMLEIKGNKMKIRTYVHKDPNSVIPQGYYTPEDFEITLKRNFIK